MPRISELPALAQATSGDLIPIVDDAGNITKKVTANKVVPDGSLSASQLATDAVTTAKIGNGQVTSAKLDYSSMPLEGASGLSATNSATTYGNLATSAAVTIDVPSTGNIALIFSARLFNTTTTDQTGYVSFVASGANTIAASDTNAISVKILSGNSDASYARVKYLTGLTPGSTTFTLQRRTTGGSLQVINADIVAIPMS